MARTAKPAKERFWERVNKHGPIPEYAPELGRCWIWLGKLTNGYGRIILEDNSRMYVHRYAHELLGDPIPEGKELDHLCRTRHCVNPKHLEPVTSQTNTLRGIGPTAVNAEKTHCLRGHKFTKENTYVGESGSRQCNDCRNFNHAQKTAVATEWKCGHPKTEENTFARLDGLSFCLKCHEKSWKQRRKESTECSRGHAFTEETLYVGSDGRRRCKLCHAEAVARGNAKKKALRDSERA